MEKAREFQKNSYFWFIDYAKALDYVDHHKLWKFLKEMGIPDHLTCPLRNLYAGQEATVRTGHGTTHWFQIGKGVHQGCILSPCLFNFYAERRSFPLWPGKSRKWRSLVGYSPWGHRESDMTEQLHFHFSLSCYKMDWKRYYCYLCQIVFCLCFSLRVFQYLILYLGL